jgi:tRNA-dihydrouridine synthase
MRKHVAWYVRGLYDNSTLCREVNHAKSPAEVEDLLLRYLDKLESAPLASVTNAGSEELDVDAEDVDARGSCAAP